MDKYGIQAARKQANVTQAALAEMLGIKQSAISKYETGKVTPTLGQISKIALALNTTVAEMCGTNFFSKHNFDISDSFASDPFAKERNGDLSHPERQLLQCFSMLNEDGRQAALCRIAELAEIPRYQLPKD